MNEQPTEQAVTRLRALLSERIGYVLPKEFRAFIQRQVSQLIKDLQLPGPAALISALEIEVSDSPLWRQFISRMTIGESYLFRNPNHMQVLRSAVLPALIERSKQRPVTIWSAGCARGEEPYTLAILLHELDPDILTRPISVVATDIDGAAIEAAREAMFSVWAFRQTPYFIQRKYFTRRDDRLELHPSVARMVQFTRHHLSNIQDTSLLPSEGFDLVLCRNVLMYLREDFRERAGRSLARWLGRDGVLIPGQVERIEGVEGVLDRRFVQSTALYFHTLGPGEQNSLLTALGVDPGQKNRDPSGIHRAIPGTLPSKIIPSEATMSAPQPQPQPNSSGRRGRVPITRPLDRAEVEAARAAVRADEAGDAQSLIMALSEPPVEVEALTGSELYDTVRSLMYSGKIEEAKACCKALIASNSLEADHYCLLAQVYLEERNPKDASEALRRAVYCDPDSLTAFYLWWLVGVRYYGPRWDRLRWTKRHLRRLLSDLPDTHPVPFIAGVTAGDIRYLMQRHWSAFES